MFEVFRYIPVRSGATSSKSMAIVNILLIPNITLM